MAARARIVVAPSIGVALAAAVVLVASLALAAPGPVSEVERRVARALYDLPNRLTPILDAVMQAGTRGAFLVAGVAVLVVTRRPPPALAVAGAGAISWLVADVLKGVVDRPRPDDAALGRAVRQAVEGGGYPSTHSAVAAGVAAGLCAALDLPRWGVAAACGVALLTATARVHLGVHWPLDVVGGLAIGALAGSLIGALGRRPAGGGEP